MNKLRICIFNTLIIVAVGLMLLSWFMPWWRCSIIAVGGWAEIHPWGLEQILGPYASAFVQGRLMPVWFAPFMWTYLALCIGLLLFSIFTKEKTISFRKIKLSIHQVIVGGVGLSYIVVVVLAVIVAATRTGEMYGTHLIGITTIDFGEGYTTDVHSGLRFGYWLACGVGPLLIILASLRNKILGKSELSV